MSNLFRLRALSVNMCVCFIWTWMNAVRCADGENPSIYKSTRKHTDTVMHSLKSIKLIGCCPFSPICKRKISKQTNSAHNPHSDRSEIPATSTYSVCAMISFCSRMQPIHKQSKSFILWHYKHSFNWYIFISVFNWQQTISAREKKTTTAKITQWNPNSGTWNFSNATLTKSM